MGFNGLPTLWPLSKQSASWTDSTFLKPGQLSQVFLTFISFLKQLGYWVVLWWQGEIEFGVVKKEGVFVCLCSEGSKQGSL